MYVNQNNYFVVQVASCSEPVCCIECDDLLDWQRNLASCEGMLHIGR